jgi:hypothetical protein
VFPLTGFIHVSGTQVEYKATISDIIPFSTSHFDDPCVKPEPWIREWKENVDDTQSAPWKNVLVITEISPYSFDTLAFRKLDGTPVTLAPQNYIRVQLPNDPDYQSAVLGQTARRANVVSAQDTSLDIGDLAEKDVSNLRESQSIQVQRCRVPLAERNLEDFVVHQLEAIEPGLALVGRQLSTPAGRLDLLCKDTSGNFVVVELKRTQGTDQVVGQILRYIGWVTEAHNTDRVRGIIIVAKKDQALMYAARAVPAIQVKEFTLSIE